MSQESSHLRRQPGVDATDMLARKRLEVELFSLDGQIRTFERIRERLLAAGKDPSVFYRQLQAHREKLVSALKQPRPGGLVESSSPILSRAESLLERPISPATFNPGLGHFEFGSSGMVQVAPATDAKDIFAEGPFPHAGDIALIPGGYPGTVAFSGHLTVGPNEIAPDQYNPAINYVWLRTWKYLIPFPPPPGLSRLTYRFDVYAHVALRAAALGNVMCFVSLGETPNLTQGTDVTVNIDGGWPVMAELAKPSSFYNGSYGFVDGQVPVQRSFMVGGGHVPGVAVIVGVAVALPMMSEVTLSFPGVWDSNISLFSSDEVGRVAYSYEPQLVLEQ